LDQTDGANKDVLVPAVEHVDKGGEVDEMDACLQVALVSAAAELDLLVGKTDDANGVELEVETVNKVEMVAGVELVNETEVVETPDGAVCAVELVDKDGVVDETDCMELTELEDVDGWEDTEVADVVDSGILVELVCWSDLKGENEVLAVVEAVGIVVDMIEDAVEKKHSLVDGNKVEDKAALLGSDKDEVDG